MADPDSYAAAETEHSLPASPFVDRVELPLAEAELEDVGERGLDSPFLSALEAHVPSDEARSPAPTRSSVERSRPPWEPELELADPPAGEHHEPETPVADEEYSELEPIEAEEYEAEEYEAEEYEAEEYEAEEYEAEEYEAEEAELGEEDEGIGEDELDALSLTGGAFRAVVGELAHQESPLPDLGPVIEPQADAGLVEAQASTARRRSVCSPYPSRLRDRPWKRRTGARREAEFARLKKKGLRLAILSRGRVRLPIERVQWLVDQAQSSSRDHWAKHLTKRIDEVVSRVNVSVELFRVLEFLVEDEVKLILEQWLYLRHGRRLRRCPYSLSWFGLTDRKEFLESPARLGVDLGRMFRRARVPAPATAASRTRYLVVVYASFARSLGQWIRRPRLSLDSSTDVFPDPPPGLTLTRLGREKFELPVENARWLLRKAGKKRGTHWSKRLTSDLLQAMALVRKSRVTVDLLRVQGPVTTLQILTQQLTSELGPYVESLNRPDKDDWPYSAWQVLPLRAQDELEELLQVELDELVALKPAAAPNDQMVLLVNAALPKLLGQKLIPRKHAQLDGFEFGRHRLTRELRREISIVARHVADSWRRMPWHSFRPVRSIAVIGHTDSVGEEEDNTALGRRRAEEAQRYLKRAISRHWAAGENPVRRIRFAPVESRGESATRAPDDPLRGNPVNRRVEIKLDAPQPGPVLDRLRARLGPLLDDPAAAGHSMGSPTADGLKCMIRKLGRADVDDRYIPVGNVLHREFTSDLFESARDLLMGLTYQEHSPEPVPDRALLDSLATFVARIYEVRSKLQRNANVKGIHEDPDNTAKREWLLKKKADDKSIQSCFPDP